MDEHKKDEGPAVSVEEKLRHEINVLKAAIAKMDRNSTNLSEQQAYPIYERILKRRIKLLNSLAT